jgi:hypothetical protein
MLPQAKPRYRSGRHRAAVKALRAIIPRKYLLDNTEFPNLATAALSYLQLLQSEESATISLTLLERVKTYEVGGTQISTPVRMEQEILAFEAAKRRIVKLKQIQRKNQNTERTEIGESENSNGEESMDYGEDSDQSLVQDKAVHQRVDETHATDTEDVSAVEDFMEIGNELEENEQDYEDDDEEDRADSNATTQSRNKETNCQTSSDPRAYPRLCQMGCRELLPGDNAIAIGLGPNGENRKVVLRALCIELLELRLRGVRATILQPESFLAVEFDDITSKDRALGILRRSLSNLELADRRDANQTSNAESSAGSNEAVHDGHPGRRADYHLNYGNLHIPEQDPSSAGDIKQALTKLGDVATTLQRLQNVEKENMTLRAMLNAHGIGSRKIAKCLEPITAGEDSDLDIIAAD